jgi:hypothetical protein
MKRTGGASVKERLLMQHSVLIVIIDAHQFQPGGYHRSGSTLNWQSPLGVRPLWPGLTVSTSVAAQARLTVSTSAASTDTAS